MATISVLGIDPGLTRCGLGIVAGPVGRPTLVHSSCVTTPADQPLERRLLAVHDAVVAAIAAHRPSVVAIERVLFSANTRTAMATGQAAGVALLAAARAGLDVAHYSPNEVKQTVTGSGAADKDAVGRLVAAQLSLPEPPRPADVADALAIALTHLARSRRADAVRRGSSAADLDRAWRDTTPTGRGGWEAVIAARGLRAAGGTAPAPPLRPGGVPPRGGGRP